MRLILFLCLSLVVVVAQATTTQAQPQQIPQGGITVEYLFGLMLLGLAIFWRWITQQIEFFKTELKSVNEKLDKEREERDKDRDEQDKRIDGLFEKMSSRLEKQIKTEKLYKEGVDHEAT